jgi:UV DNA damage endonuclease
MNRIGYCCISLGVNEGLKKKDHVSVNRSMIKKTFDAKGLPYVSELIIPNLEDTIRVLKYNLKKDIKVYRMSSDSFPWMSHYSFSDLPNFPKIQRLLTQIGNFVKDNDIRVSYHPGPFNILGSEKETVVVKTIDELDKHSELMDLMGLEQSTYYPINIHLNVTTPSHEQAAERFCTNFHRLKDSTKSRLTIENDDKPSQYSVKMLYELVHSKIGIPIVVDSLHYLCHPDDMSWEDTLKLGLSTWKTKPLCHHSSSKKLNEDNSAILSAHADFLYEKFDSCGYEIDIELECKQKDIALVKYIREFNSI